RASRACRESAIVTCRGHADSMRSWAHEKSPPAPAARCRSGPNSISERSIVGRGAGHDEAIRSPRAPCYTARMRKPASASLTHVDSRGRASMVDVAAKPPRPRRAVARATLHTTTAVIETLVDQKAPKGDVVAVSRIAGIQAAKRTAELIPLAHQVPLSSVD